MPTIAIDGVALHYEEQGTGSPILFIHGAAGFADIWGPSLGELAASHRVISYDRRGYEQSRHAPVADYHRHGEDAAGLLRALNAAPATVVGWSGGGLTALDLVIHHPDLVRALVIIEPPLHAKRHMSFGMFRAFAAVQVLRRFGSERHATARFLRWATSHTSGGCAFDQLPVAVQDRMLDTAPATLADLDAGTGEYLSMAQIAAIRCPVTCLVDGLSDSALVDATRRILKALPSAKHVTVAGVGHALPMEAPRALVEATQRAAAGD